MTVEAQTAEGYLFVNWTDGDTGQLEQFLHLHHADGKCVLTANFESALKSPERVTSFKVYHGSARGDGAVPAPVHF